MLVTPLQLNLPQCHGLEPKGQAAEKVKGMRSLGPQNCQNNRTSQKGFQAQTPIS